MHFSLVKGEMLFTLCRICLIKQFSIYFSMTQHTDFIHVYAKNLIDFLLLLSYQ